MKKNFWKSRRRGAAIAVLCLAAGAARADDAGSMIDQGGCRHVAAVALADAVSWSGACVNGWAEGEGTQQWFRGGHFGQAYVGTLVHGVRQGQGSLLMPGSSQRTYEGGFADGKFDGHGVFRLPDGGSLEIEFHDNRPEGPGTYTSAAGVATEVVASGGQLKTREGQAIPTVSKSSGPTCTQMSAPKLPKMMWGGTARFIATIAVDGGAVSLVRMETLHSSGNKYVDLAITDRIAETIRTRYVCTGDHVVFQQEFAFQED